MYPLFFIWVFVGDGIRKAVKKTVRWTVFRPWENPLTCESIRYGCGRRSNYFGYNAYHKKRVASATLFFIWVFVGDGT